MFAIVCHLHPIFIFEDKARSLPVKVESCKELHLPDNRLYINALSYYVLNLLRPYKVL